MTKAKVFNFNVKLEYPDAMKQMNQKEYYTAEFSVLAETLNEATNMLKKWLDKPEQTGWLYKQWWSITPVSKGSILVDKEKISAYKETKNINPKDAQITLLTIKQAKKLPKDILACGKWWWLRSPGNSQFSAATVNTGGGVNEYGDRVDFDTDAVRPAFEIENLNSKFGEKVYVGKLLCTVIDKDFVLADECVCHHRFDSKSNDWETSELKTFIESKEFVEKYVLKSSKKLGEYKPGDTVTIGKCEYIVLEHKEKVTAIIAKKPTKNMAFGSNGNYAKSDVRAYCNGEFYRELCEVVGKENIVPHTVKLVADNGSNENAMVKDNVSILTNDSYRRYHKLIPKIDCTCWTATRPDALDSCYSRYINVVYPSGVLNWVDSGCCNAVRPFCTISSNVSVSDPANLSLGK